MERRASETAVAEGMERRASETAVAEGVVRVDKSLFMEL